MGTDALAWVVGGLDRSAGLSDAVGFGISVCFVRQVGVELFDKVVFSVRYEVPDEVLAGW